MTRTTRPQGSRSMDSACVTIRHDRADEAQQITAAPVAMRMATAKTMTAPNRPSGSVGPVEIGPLVITRPTRARPSTTARPPTIAEARVRRAGVEQRAERPAEDHEPDERRAGEGAAQDDGSRIDGDGAGQGQHRDRQQEQEGWAAQAPVRPGPAVSHTLASPSVSASPTTISTIGGTRARITG